MDTEPYIVFSLHGYPNGPYMYKKLVKKLIINGFTAVNINFRTGTSIKDNINLVREIISSYPKNIPKAIVAHDWGAYISWQLYDEFENFNIKKFFVMSVSNKISNNTNLMRLYQLPLILSKYCNPTISKFLQYQITGKEYREEEFDTIKSNYYYNYDFFIKYLFNLVQEVKLNKNIKIYYMASFQDENLGFVNKDLLSEPIKYENHFFYNKNTKLINNKIIKFLKF
jgi:hypothetical protein